MPVDITRTLLSMLPIASAVRAAMAAVSDSPCVPVHAFALPELITTPRNPVPGVRSRSKATGAAKTRF